MSNKFSKPIAPPPPLFLGSPERDLVHQINAELTERVLSQQILYYAISLEHTNYHPLYGEAIQKTFFPPIHISCLVEWDDQPTQYSSYGADHLANLTIHFFKRRITEDKDLFVRDGDFVQYGNDYYEIVSIAEPKELWGQTTHKIEISAKCIKARRSLFNGE